MLIHVLTAYYSYNLSQKKFQWTLESMTQARVTHVVMKTMDDNFLVGTLILVRFRLKAFCTFNM